MANLSLKQYDIAQVEIPNFMRTPSLSSGKWTSEEVTYWPAPYNIFSEDWKKWASSLHGAEVELLDRKTINGYRYPDRDLPECPPGWSVKVVDYCKADDYRHKFVVQWLPADWLTPVDRLAPKTKAQSYEEASYEAYAQEESKKGNADKVRQVLTTAILQELASMRQERDSWIKKTEDAERSRVLHEVKVVDFSHKINEISQQNNNLKQELESTKQQLVQAQKSYFSSIIHKINNTYIHYVMLLQLTREAAQRNWIAVYDRIQNAAVSLKEFWKSDFKRTRWAPIWLFGLTCLMFFLTARSFYKDEIIDINRQTDADLLLIYQKSFPLRSNPIKREATISTSPVIEDVQLKLSEIADVISANSNPQPKKFR